MARMALFGDVHGNSVALAAVRKAIKAAKPDAIMVAGDLVLNGPEPADDARRDPRAGGRPARSSSRATPTSPWPTSTTRPRSRG